MNARRRGVSLIEVLVAATILSGIFLTLYAILHTSTDDYANQSIHVKLDQLARDTLEQIVRELRNAGAVATDNLIVPGEPLYVADGVSRWADIDFTLHSGINPATGAPIFGDRIRYRWVVEPDEVVNGVDDNRNGLIDEGYIERTETLGAAAPVVSKLCRGVVPNKGLAVDASPSRVGVELEVMGLDAKRRIQTRRAQSAADLRN